MNSSSGVLGASVFAGPALLAYTGIEFYGIYYIAAAFLFSTALLVVIKKNLFK